MTASAQHALISRPVLVVGALMMVLGLILAAPSLINSFRYRVVQGVVLDAFVHPISDDQYRIEICYRYPIAAKDLAGFPGGAYGLGYDRCDTLGNPVDDLVLDAAEVGAFFADLRNDHAMVMPVLYDPGDPAVARAPLRGGSFLWTFGSLGMLLMLAPPLCWTILIGSRLLLLMNRRR